MKVGSTDLEGAPSLRSVGRFQGSAQHLRASASWAFHSPNANLAGYSSFPHVFWSLEDEEQRVKSRRGLSLEQVALVINTPAKIIDEGALRIFQSVVVFEDGAYLLRVFVNMNVEPKLVVTVYRTSKISNYHDGEV